MTASRRPTTLERLNLNDPKDIEAFCVAVIMTVQEKIMGIILASLLFGSVSGILAHNKARNALGWFVAGCLIGPFALVVVFLPMAIKEGVTKKCPHCSETINIDAQVCRFCRSALKGASYS